MELNYLEISKTQNPRILKYKNPKNPTQKPTWVFGSCQPCIYYLYNVYKFSFAIQEERLCSNQKQFSNKKFLTIVKFDNFRFYCCSKFNRDIRAYKYYQGCQTSGLSGFFPNMRIVRAYFFEHCNFHLLLVIVWYSNPISSENCQKLTKYQGPPESR